jgi:hypothetical protein
MRNFLLLWFIIRKKSVEHLINQYQYKKNLTDNFQPCAKLDQPISAGEVSTDPEHSHHSLQTKPVALAR